MANTLYNAAKVINDDLYDIREAANTKGAGIAADTPLSEWSDKISLIPAPANTYAVVSESTGDVIGWGQDVYILPTKDANGEDVPQSIPMSLPLAYSIMGKAEHVVIPAHYGTITGRNESLAADSQTIVKRLDVNATSLAYNGWMAAPTLEELNLNEVVQWLGSYANNYNDAMRMCYRNANKLKVSAPKATKIQMNGQWGTTFREVEFNMPLLDELNFVAYNPSYAVGAFTYGYGTFVLPSLTKLMITGIGMYNFAGTDATKYQDWRLPSLQTIGNPASYATFGIADTIKNHVRIGPNLTTLGANVASKWRSAISNSHLEIHIPSGLDPNTSGNTAYTLTHASGGAVAYTADYDYQEDLT